MKVLKNNIHFLFKVIKEIKKYYSDISLIIDDIIKRATTTSNESTIGILYKNTKISCKKDKTVIYLKSYGKYKKKSHIIAVKKEIKEHIKSDFYKKIKKFLLADFILKFKQKIRKITGKPFSDSKNVKL